MHACLLLFALANATSYRITITPAKGAPVVAHVVAAGANKRVAVERAADQPYTFDVLLLDGSTVTALNTSLKTWYAAEAQLMDGPRLYKPLMGMKAEVRDIKVALDEEPDDELLSGHKVRKFVARINYVLRGKISGERVDASCGATILIWTTSEIDEALSMPALTLTTGISEVDALLAPKLATVHGFPLKTILSATRVFAGGVPQTEMLAATADEFSATAADAALFQRPADYVNQKPLIGAPAR
jgi:hypothetical protein